MYQSFRQPLRQHALATALVAVAALGAAACSKETGGVVAPSNPLVTFVLQAPILAAGTTTTMTIEVKEPDGKPAAVGTEVVLSASGGQFERPRVRTVEGGTVVVSYRAADAAGQVDLVATANNVTTTAKLLITSAPVARVSVSASPSILPQGGGQIDLTATVFSQSGAPVAGAPVNFVTSAGTLAPDTTIISNDQGQALARLSSTQGAIVRARVHTLDSEPLQITMASDLRLTITASPERVFVNETATFTVTPSDLERVGRMSFDFGDGESTELESGSGVRSATHVYTARGGYNVTVVFVASNGVETTATIRFNVDSQSTDGPPDQPDDPTLPFKLSDVKWLHTNVSSWAETSIITSVHVSSQICIEHTKAGKWPVLDGVEGNPWVFAQVNGRWYAATYEWLRPGQICKFVDANSLGPNTGEEPLSSWRPRKGELVGFMVSTHARFGKQTIAERSNIVVIPWP
jgi:hypothetical protein